MVPQSAPSWPIGPSGGRATPGAYIGARAVPACGEAGLAARLSTARVVDRRSVEKQTGGTTNLLWSVRMQPPSLLYRLLQPIIAREIRKAADTDFANLKRILERREGRPATSGEGWAGSQPIGLMG